MNLKKIINLDKTNDEKVLYYFFMYQHEKDNIKKGQYLKKIQELKNV